ncbi:hypothetical protein D1094_03715 [Colwellia sp. RSH04]|nr:hypothetical protein D1094_03715 [Colwellia sp. RSH04]
MLDVFLIKKVLTVLLMPINIVIILLITGLIFKRRKARFSSFNIKSAAIILFVCAFAPISDRLMYSLESSYPVYIQSTKQVDYIVVLGCNHTSTTLLPATSELATCSLQRTVEAFRLYKLHPEARVITSGYAFSDEVSNASKVKEALVLMGIPEQKIIQENFAKDTEEEAQLISPRIQGTTSILVTNANHMPRAISYFLSQHVQPIAAPTGYWVKDINSSKHWGYYVPSSKKLEQTSIAWYEYLGLTVQWIKALIV